MAILRPWVNPAKNGDLFVSSFLGEDFGGTERSRSERKHEFKP